MGRAEEGRGRMEKMTFESPEQIVLRMLLQLRVRESVNSCYFVRFLSGGSSGSGSIEFAKEHLCTLNKLNFFLFKVLTSSFPQPRLPCEPCAEQSAMPK
jgi:hypothetical protein